MKSKKCTDFNEIKEITDFSEITDIQEIKELSDFSQFSKESLLPLGVLEWKFLYFYKMNRFPVISCNKLQKIAFYRLVYVMNRFQWIFIKSPYFSEITDSNEFSKESLIPFSAFT